VGADQGVLYSVTTGNTGSFSLTIGVSLGLRIMITEKIFIEPYGRIGLPVQFAGGVLAGVRYNNEKK
jgi:hypothetical protein